MPFFEYRCNNCESEFEELIRSDSDIATLKCPNCGASDVGKMLSVFGMVAPSGKVVTSTAGGYSACSGCTKNSCAGCH